MNTSQLAIIFNAWAAEYAANPEKFGTILNPDGTPIENYGEHAAECFRRIAIDQGFASLVHED
jgi:hypothetical protein